MTVMKRRKSKAVAGDPMASFARPFRPRLVITFEQDGALFMRVAVLSAALSGGRADEKSVGTLLTPAARLGGITFFKIYTRRPSPSCECRAPSDSIVKVTRRGRNL